MLHKNHRLTKPQFSQAYAKGKKFHFTHLTVVYVPATTFSGSVVVGKKVSKLAVKRNTLRRRIYARLGTFMRERAVTGIYIIILKPSFTSLSRTAADAFVAESIDAVLQKA